MKKLFFILISFAIIFSSCNKKIKTCSGECGSIKPVKTELTINLDSSNFTIDIEYWKTDSITLSYKTIGSAQFEKVLLSVKKETGFGHYPYAIVFFTNKLLDEDNSISMTDAIGYGYYYLDENKMYFRFFQKQNERCKNIADLNCEVEDTISNDLNTITLNCFDNALYPKKSWILFFSNEHTSNNLDKPKHELTERLVNYLNN